MSAPTDPHRDVLDPPFGTHEVTNQSPVFEDVNLFTSDRVLREAVAANGIGEDSSAWRRLSDYGAQAGSAEALAHAANANRYGPVLEQFDQKGRRVDRVRFHPSWDYVMSLGMRFGLHNASWRISPEGAVAPGDNVARSALVYMAAQMEPGHNCPLTMTNAAVPVLSRQARSGSARAALWLSKIAGDAYDTAAKPARDKASVLLGMGMTEKQGGTDVRANTTRAEPVGAGGPDTEYRLTGHKWFMSAPQIDGFLVLAQAPGGLSCFLVPRMRDAGGRNGIYIQRLKDKLGNKSNASSEVEFLDAAGYLLGEEGRGVPAIIEMVNYTRLDCAVASAGMMRSALAQAALHTASRSVFQRKLIDQPLMAQVLADMTLEQAGSSALVFRLAKAFDRAHTDEFDAAFARVMTPVIKYIVCKRVPHFVYEAMECLGGNGYVETGPMALLFRESPLNAIWEGSGNVMCLDFLRVVQKSPDMVAGLLDQILKECSGAPALASAFEKIKTAALGASEAPQSLRILVEQLADAVAAWLLMRREQDDLYPDFLATRLTARPARQFGACEIAKPAAILHHAAVHDAPLGLA